MAAPLPALLIPELDADHERLEALFRAAADADETALAERFDAVLAEASAHFRREEAFFERMGARNLTCHRARHLALDAIGRDLREKFRRETDPLRRRALIVEDFARAIADHVFTMDRISAEQAGLSALDAIHGF